MSHSDSTRGRGFDPLAPFHGKSASFWGAVMIGIGGLWLLVKVLPFILGFAIPALLVYAGYVLLTRPRHSGGTN